MKMKKGLLLCLFSLGMVCVPVAAASAWSNTGVAAAPDDQVISGTVEDAEGPMIGATVKVAGTNNGTVTDFNGEFKLKCKPGDMLEVSYVGYTTKTVKAEQGMKIMMNEDKTTLSEVVVTALGIKRDRKALGYGLAEVKGEELTKAKETNVINSLSGKVAGLVVQNTAGGASGSTRVLLRGNTEMTGNNQPLYVIDGVPLDNTNFGSAGEGGGYDLGDGISAINPDDIENMTVLKGPAASALYGSRASHGVILITTKKAEKDRVSVEYNGSFTVDTQLAKWDDIQQTYGMGNGGKLSTSSTSGTNSSWGPKADGFVFKYFDGEEREFMMYPNNADGFFRTGFTTQNSAILSVNSGKTGMRFSMTDMRNRDILPNTKMSRDNFNLRVTTSAGPVDLDFTANARTGSGYSDFFSFRCCGSFILLSGLSGLFCRNLAVCMCCGTGSGNASEDREVCNSVAAQAVIAVHTAGDFARCKEAVDHVALCVDNLSCIVDLNSAHRVVDTRLHLDRIVRCLVQRIGKGHAAKVRVFLRFDTGIPLLHCRCKCICRCSDRFRQCLIGLTRLGVALVDVALNNIGRVAHAAVHNQPGVSAGLFKLCG